MGTQGFLNSVVGATEKQVSASVDDEMVILNVETGVYYGLKQVGARVWSLLQEPRRVRFVRDRLVQEYEVSAERCEDDLRKLLQELECEGLVYIRDETEE